MGADGLVGSHGHSQRLRRLGATVCWLALAACAVLGAVRPGIARAVSPPTAGACGSGTTLVIVAHEDDDLLFLSPDLVGDVKSDRCVHAVFLTAGDAGSTAAYWAGRELGS